MLVNSVLGANVGNTSFKANLEEQIFANLSDRDLRNIALAKASQDVNDKKHRRIDKALLYSLPLAGGLASVAGGFSPDTVAKLGQKNVRALKLAHFGASSLKWAAGLAALELLWDAKDYLANKVDIIKKNPVISNVATFMAGFAVFGAVDRAGMKGVVKVLDSLNASKVLPHYLKARKFLNDNPIINKASEFMSKFPSPIKDVAKGAAAFAPLIVIATNIAHLFAHQKAKAQVAVKNYDELKQAQESIRNDINASNIGPQKRSITVADLRAEYEKMLKNNTIAGGNEKISFEEFVRQFIG